jgi:hypothetical protein
LHGDGFKGGLADVCVWSSSVCRFEGLVDGRTLVAQKLAWRRPIGTGLHSTGNGSTVLGMATHRRGWPHRGRDGRKDVLCLSRVMASPQSCARSTVVHPSRVPPCLFEGLGVGEGREQAAQCFGVTPASPHSECAVPVQCRGWLHSARTGFSGGATGSAWRGFAFCL